MTLTINLPWPPKELSPNARQHWASFASAKKSYRATCYCSAKGQGATRIEAPSLLIKVTFHAPTRRAYDLDNALARMKSGFDGLADALCVDDANWSFVIQRGESIKGGSVVVEVTHA